MMMSIIRSMIKTRRKQKFRERDEKTNFSLLLLLLCLSFYVLRRSTTDNERRQTDILSSSLFLPRTHERTFTRRRSQEDKQKKMLFARSRLNVLFSKFLRAQKRVRISFRPKVVSVVFALKKDRRLSFRRSSNVKREKKKYTYARVVKK